MLPIIIIVVSIMTLVIIIRISLQPMFSYCIISYFWIKLYFSHNTPNLSHTSRSKLLSYILTKASNLLKHVWLDILCHLKRVQCIAQSLPTPELSAVTSALLAYLLINMSFFHVVQQEYLLPFSSDSSPAPNFTCLTSPSRSGLGIFSFRKVLIKYHSQLVSLLICFLWN